MTPVETNFMVHAKLIGVEECPWMELLKRADEFARDPDLMIANYAMAVRNIVQDHPERWAIIRTPFLALVKADPAARPSYRSDQRMARIGTDAKTKWARA